MQSPKKDLANVISFYPSERPDLIEKLDNKLDLSLKN